MKAIGRKIENGWQWLSGMEYNVTERRWWVNWMVQPAWEVLIFVVSAVALFGFMYLVIQFSGALYVWLFSGGGPVDSLYTGRLDW